MRSKEKTQEETTNLPQKRPDTAAILKASLYEEGMTPQAVAKMILELCNWTTTRFDKNGNSYECVDGNLRYKALELWSKITGGVAKEGTKHLHLGLPDDKINDLFSKSRG